MKNFAKEQALWLLDKYSEGTLDQIDKQIQWAQSELEDAVDDSERFELQSFIEFMTRVRGELINLQTT
jgi:hypothetical protein